MTIDLPRVSCQAGLTDCVCSPESGNSSSSPLCPDVVSPRLVHHHDQFHGAVIDQSGGGDTRISAQPQGENNIPSNTRIGEEGEKF